MNGTNGTKPGWKTTELWATGGVFLWASEILSSNDAWQTQVAAILAAATVGSTYIWSRVRAKGGAA